MIVVPLSDKEFIEEDETNSWELMKAQEQNGSVNMLDDPEEDAWDRELP